jgi:DNA replication licensing factor MCM7
LDFDPFSAKFIRSYVLKAKTFEPNLDKDLLPEISNTYVNARAMERQAQGNSHVKSVTNVRTLLGMLRLAQAHARLRFSNVVERGDFEEAVRLTLEAKQSVLDQTNSSKNSNGREDSIAAVWGVLKNKLEIAGKDTFVLVSDIEKFGLNHGYTLAQIQAALASYEELSIVSYNDERNRICLTSQ